MNDLGNTPPKRVAQSPLHKTIRNWAIGIIFILLVLVMTFGSTFLDFWGFRGKHRSDTSTTLTQAYDLFMADLDSIVAGQLGSYESRQVLEIDTDGMFRVQGLNPERAPYLIGQVIRKENNQLYPEQLPNLLRDEKLQDTRIRFPEAELTLFLDQSAEVNIDAISVAKAGLGVQDKLNLVYEKAFSAVGTRDWFHFQQWESMIDEFGLSESDSLWVIEQVKVKKFKYSVFQRVDGTFSATPTPVVAIGGEVYQQSGSERNIYEVFIQLSQLRFPKSESDETQSFREDGLPTSSTQSFIWNLTSNE
ncbi:hypothetical protein OAQ89_01330 [Balneolaceae bacterium]|nr:hypothetical protein [Balneolaceae bacterium]